MAGATVVPRVDSLLEDAAAQAAERPALVAGDAVLTYGELELAVDRLAARLARAAGLEALVGARVVVIAPNAPALVVALFAASRLGAVAVPLSARLREHELRTILADAAPLVVVSVDAYLGLSFRGLLPRLVRDLTGVRACLFVAADGSVTAELPAGRFGGAEPLAGDVLAILYTSGTTGEPKGALAIQRREADAAPRLASVLALAPEDEVALVIPVSHAFGLTCLLAAVASAATAVLVDSTATLGPLLRAVEARGATVLHGSPSLFAALLKSRPAGLATVRTGFVGGAPVPPGLIERLERAGMGILNVYGLTETGAVSCCRPSDPDRVRHGTAGRPLPGYEVRVAPAAGGGPGELHVRGPYVTPGYFGRRAETEPAFTGGWFRTGDLATIEEGAVRIAGRAKELAHVGGFNVFPGEVEAVLAAHPDVVQAAVVAVPDERMGEALHAFVVARPGSAPAPAELLRFARGQIAGYKLPYAIRVVPELPLLASGKPDKRALTKAAAGRGEEPRG
ncbi:MAG: acyl--CoA ligase [Thermoleophilia bacterium]|nr:acyl--CoA ligase [Thermoleophilia bacterium]